MSDNVRRKSLQTARTGGKQRLRRQRRVQRHQVRLRRDLRDRARPVPQVFVYIQLFGRGHVARVRLGFSRLQLAVSDENGRLSTATGTPVKAYGAVPRYV